MDPTRNAIVSLLASRPDQPRKALYQHSFPYSQRWGYLRDRDTPIIHFDENDIRRLHKDGVLRFIRDDRGRRCAVLTDTATGGHAVGAPSVQAPADKTESPPIIPSAEGAPPVTPYTFEQLLNRDVQLYGPDLVFHLHVPKLGGITVAALLRQIDFFTLHFNMNTKSFFDVVPEERFFDSYRSPPPRPAYALTGHYRLDHPFFQRAWMPHLIVTTLRDPIKRLLSHYNHTLLVEGSPWHDEVARGMSFLEYAKYALSAFGPIYGFFDDTGQGDFAPTGIATPQECLRNLVTRVGLYGLAERFDEFAVLMGYLLGRPGVAVVSRNVTATLPNPNGLSLKTNVSVAEEEELSELLKDDIWFYEQAVKEYRRRVSDTRVQQLFSEALPLFRSYHDSINQIAALRDPGNPARGAFDHVRAPLYSAERD